MKIAFAYHLGRTKRVHELGKGKVPSEFFLGAYEMEQKGHKVDIFELDPSYRTGISGYPISWLHRNGFLPDRMDGEIIAQTGQWIDKINGYDCVVGTASGLAFSFAWWSFIGSLKIPVVAIHCGLLNNPYNWIRKSLTVALLRRTTNLLYGEGERSGLIAMAADLEKTLYINHFGVDESFWFPKDEKTGDYFLSVGNDGRRDYRTLLEAASQIPCEIKIITRHELPAERPQNVTWIKGDWQKAVISDEDLRKLYQEAIGVIVPLAESYQPSGQSVTLQAMACGKPVVLTQTKGLWSKEMMRNGENVLMVKPRDPDQLSACMLKLYHDAKLQDYLGENARDSIVKNATIHHYSNRLEDVCMHLKG
jgi:glycosyltransferase involved in cell wall biosynthesis